MPYNRAGPVRRVMVVVRPAGRAASVAMALLLFASCGGSPGSTPAPPPTQSPNPTAWLTSNTVPFNSVDINDNLDDLEPLRAMVGNARIVALGEATHGTDEFFRMKARILRFLVERMGFTAFAIEATWPEANRIDRYVRGGDGDPEVLLSGLYFWTWNTSSVLEMIRWMRRFNDGGGHLGFYGFDMQYPGMALDNVLRFVRAVDAGAAAEFTQRTLCLARYGNDARGFFVNGNYGDEAAAYRDACHDDLKWVHGTLTDRQARYTAASSPSEWAKALQSARVALQYEEMVSKRSTRDAAMAENTAWLLDQLGPDGKIVLWAHNGHVRTTAGSMGQPLRQKYGASMVVVGFTFAQGTFTAITQSGDRFEGLATHAAGAIVSGSYEDYFAATKSPRFILDMRNRDLSAPSASWLSGPRAMRTIGCCYDPSAPDSYWDRTVRLPSAYDLVIYIETSTPTQVLRFRYPATF